MKKSFISSFGAIHRKLPRDYASLKRKHKSFELSRPYTPWQVMPWQHLLQCFKYFDRVYMAFFESSVQCCWEPLFYYSHASFSSVCSATFSDIGIDLKTKRRCFNRNFALSPDLIPFFSAHRMSSFGIILWFNKRQPLNNQFIYQSNFAPNSKIFINKMYCKNCLWPPNTEKKQILIQWFFQNSQYSTHDGSMFERMEHLWNLKAM